MVSGEYTMKTNKFGLALCAEEHLLAEKPLHSEAMVLYGISNLTAIISKLRKDGWIIQSQYVPYARAIRRMEGSAVVMPPKNLPTRKIQLIEYWMSR